MKKTAIITGMLALATATLAQPSKDEVETIVIPAGHTMQGVPLGALLEEYGRLVERTILAAQNLPNATFDFKTNNPLTYKEARAFYETLLSQRQIAVIPLGEKFVQVIPAAEVSKTPPKFTTMSKDELPDGEIYIIKTVQLEHALPSELADVLNSYAKSPNAVQSIDSTKTLVLRDYSSNVKRMLELIELVDVEEKIEDEYEIVRIKYALSEDIAAVLGNLTTGGSATVGSSGSSSSGSRPSTSSRTSGSSGSTSSRGGVSQRSTGSSSRGSSSRPTSGSSSSLQNRLNTITRGATTSGSGPPILGDVRIISNARNNEVLMLGKRRYLDRAVEMIKQLDTVQKQVLIESMIIDVALGDDKTFGTSLRQQKNVVAGVPTLDGRGAARHDGVAERERLSSLAGGGTRQSNNADIGSGVLRLGCLVVRGANVAFD